MDKTEIKPAGGISPAGKNKIEVTNPKQKEILKSAGIAAAVLGVAGGAYALHSMESKPEETGADGEGTLSPVDNDPVVMYTDAPMAAGVNNEMGFGEAFAAARAEVGPGGFFLWNGAAYNTYNAEEWAVMSAEDRQQFMASVEMPDLSGNMATNDGIAEVENANNGVAGSDEFIDEGKVGEVSAEESQAGSIDVNIEQEPEIEESDFIEVDIDGDGIIDTLAIDFDGDGLADAIIIDTDGNAVPDLYFINSDDIPGLDLTIIDSLETGDLENAIQIPMEDQVIIEVEEPAYEPPYDGGQSDHLADMHEPLPDIDNNFDVSDYDESSLMG